MCLCFEKYKENLLKIVSNAVFIEIQLNFCPIHTKKYTIRVNYNVSIFVDVRFITLLLCYFSDWFVLSVCAMRPSGSFSTFSFLILVHL